MRLALQSPLSELELHPGQWSKLLLALGSIPDTCTRLVININFQEKASKAIHRHLVARWND